MIENFITQFGLLAVFSLMTLESALIPIPSEVTMAFAGFLSGLGIINFWMAILVGALGNLAGSLLAYFVGLKLGENNVRLLIKKYGKYLLIHEKDFDLSLSWFKKYGQAVAFTSRLLPVLRTFISLPAGIAEMNLPVFSALTFVGSFIWSAFLAYLGLKLGQNWQIIDPYFKKFQFLIIGAILLGGVYYVYRHLKKKD